jgi:tRNA(Ile)-lysidine synthase
VLVAVRRALIEHCAVDASPPLTIAVALSGGRDSMALLDAMATLAPELALEVSAVHVHHGLSPNADAWADFCAAACAARSVPLVVRRVAVARQGGESLEASARAARYAAYAGVTVRFIALAHHADDQAETLLLQLLRGAGPRGLAAMPRTRDTGAGPRLLRPFLGLPRRTIAAYVAARGLAFVDDESNADVGRKRNFLRHEVAPRLGAAFPGYPATLARSAELQAEAVRLADALAALDAEGAAARESDGTRSLDRAALARLAAIDPARARNLLRWFLRELGLPAPSSARLSAMHEQLAHATPDARVRLAHAGVELGVHRGRIRAHPPPIARYAIPWQGEPSLTLPHGTLEFAACTGAGIAQAVVRDAGWVVRPRVGGERIQLERGGPTRKLKHLLQYAAIPPWQRDAWPLVCRGDDIVAIPGIGIDAGFQAASDAAGYDVRWRPMPE